MVERSRFRKRVLTLLIGGALGSDALIGCGEVSEDPIARWKKEGAPGGGGAGTTAGGSANQGGVGSSAGGNLSEGGSAQANGGHAPEGGTAGTDGWSSGGDAGQLSGEGGRAATSEGGRAATSEGGRAATSEGGRAATSEGGRAATSEGGRADGEAGAAGQAGGGQAGAGQAGAGQAGIGQAGAGQASVSVPKRCSPTAQFGTPARVPGLPEGAIRLRLNPDETVGYYARYLSVGEYDIARAVRAPRHDSFSDITPVGTNDGGWDLTPSITADESMLYFESQRNTGTAWRIHQSVRHSEFDAFVSADPVPGLRAAGSPNSGNDGGPFITPSGDTLYFHSTRFQGGQGLARAVRVGTSFTGVEQVMVTFSSGSPRTPSTPVVTPDELTLYFTALEDGKKADMWRATRAKKSDSFGVATPVSELNTTQFNEVPSFISEDGCRLYFDRNTNASAGWSPDYGTGYVAERVPDIE